jgi:hypothetical protein
MTSRSRERGLILESLAQVNLREPSESTVNANARTTGARRSARTLPDLATSLVRAITTKGLQAAVTWRYRRELAARTPKAGSIKLTKVGGLEVTGKG